MVKCSPPAAGHVIPSAVTSPHDRRAHGLPQGLTGPDAESAVPPAATGTEPATTAARQNPLDAVDSTTRLGSCEGATTGFSTNGLNK